MKKRILITNDDGITSPGLQQLAKAAQQFGEVWIVAPEGQRSAVSHCFTYLTDIVVKEYDYPLEGVKAFSCSGMPADCVRVGMQNLLPEKPDYVFSGINQGFNMAADIQYSGTVGAVLEGAFWGCHSIAFSHDFHGDHKITALYLSEMMERCMSMPLGKNQVWNINFPECEPEEFQGVLWDRTVSEDPFYEDYYEETAHADGSHSYHVVQKRNWKASEGTDLDAIMTNHISVGIVNNLK